MLLACVCVFLAQHRPCENQWQSPEPPIAIGATAPIVQNIENGFVPYHLIPRFPIADAVLERAREVNQNRPHLRRR